LSGDVYRISREAFDSKCHEGIGQVGPTLSQILMRIHACARSSSLKQQPRETFYPTPSVKFPLTGEQIQAIYPNLEI